MNISSKPVQVLNVLCRGMIPRLYVHVDFEISNFSLLYVAGINIVLRDNSFVVLFVLSSTDDEDLTIS